MQELDIYATGYSENEDEPTRVSGCGIVLVFTDKFRREVKRDFGFALRTSTLELAHLQSARIGLACMRPTFRDAKTRLRTASPEVFRLLSSNGEHQSDKYQAVLAETKRWIGYYTDFSVELEPSQSPFLQRAKFLAQQAAVTQFHSDSGTIK